MLRSTCCIPFCECKFLATLHTNNYWAWSRFTFGTPTAESNINNRLVGIFMNKTGTFEQAILSICDLKLNRNVPFLIEITILLCISFRSFRSSTLHTIHNKLFTVLVSTFYLLFGIVLLFYLKMNIDRNDF